MPAPHPARPYIFLIAATACWGVGTVLSKLALDRGLAPMVLLVVELFASCSFVLAVLVAVSRGRPRFPRTHDYSRVAALGALNPALGYSLGLLGLTTVSASLAVLVWALEPLLVAVLAVFLLRERLSAPVAFLTVTAVGGAVVVLGGSGASGDARGLTLTFAAVSACALYTVLTRRLLLDDGSLIVVLGQQVLALVLVLIALVVLAGATGGDVLGDRPDLATVGLAAASGLVYYGLAFVFYVSGLRHVPAVTAGAVLPLIPVWGLAAAFLAGDRLSAGQWLGAAVVGLAVLAIGLLEARRSRADAAVSNRQDSSTPTR